MKKQILADWTIPTDGEPTGESYPLRAATLHDIALLVPIERIPACLDELMGCAAQMAALAMALRETGQTEDDIRALFSTQPVLPWEDDGRGSVSMQVIPKRSRRSRKGSASPVHRNPR